MEGLFATKADAGQQPYFVAKYFFQLSYMDVAKWYLICFNLYYE